MLIDEAIEALESQIDDTAIIACSGGIDSSVAAVLAHRAVGSLLHCVYVDTGFMRKGETEEVRDMFKKHGKVKDFALMRDDDGNLRGFGFITFESKAMADAAIAALNGQKIKGRRIGVRDAEAPREEKPKRAPRPQGARLYVGNLPFKATEDDLSALFKGHCDSVHVQWATDRSGRKKAFAFVTIQPES
ncbi:MAG: hypothetical protein EB157_02220, partial [Euryarchaeota archaeon]|nr:hypothetical protein [Euryarchaeota archaeon]